MARIGVGWTSLLGLALLLGAAGCAQVIGIGDPHECQDGTEYCDGVCVDTAVDQENCGTCGNSCKGASCVDSKCVDSDCNREFVGCVTPQSASADCHGLDCVEFAGAPAPVCLRRCTENEDCPFDMFCAPRGDVSYAPGFAQYQLAGGHCVYSFCGGVSGTWYANGVANGGCRVGGDGYLRQGAVDDRPGTCIKGSATAVGECREEGRVEVSGKCTFEPTGCVPRTSYKGCKSAEVCLAVSGSAEGTCYQVCDPNLSGQCPSGMICRDYSAGAKTLGACEY